MILSLFNKIIIAPEIDMGFIRISKWGISWKNLNKHRLMFSDRYGHKKSIIIGHYCFSFLPNIEMKWEFSVKWSRK